MAENKTEEVKKIIDKYWGAWGWLEDSKRTEIAREICQLKGESHSFEPKHSGKARFKTAFADELDDPKSLDKEQGMAEDELLLTDGEIESVWIRSQGCPRKEAQMGMEIAKVQLAKAQPIIEAKARKEELEGIVKGLARILKEEGDLRNLERALVDYVETLKAGE